MPKLPSKKDLKQLAKFNEPYCVSIYAPFIEWTGSTNPNKIMLKNLIKESRLDLLAAGLKGSVIEKTLRPIKALLEGQQFWPARHESLAIFAHSHLFKYFRIPAQQVPRMLSVQRGFSIEPLTQLVDENMSYMVLTLGHNNVSLYKANRYQIKPIKLRGFPASMYKTLGIDELPRSIEPHPVGPAERGSHAFHSQYNVSQTDKTMLLQFFRQINKQLGRFLQGKQIPVVLAGVNYLLPIYRMVNTYPHLVPVAINGSNAVFSPDSIRKQTWNVIKGIKNGRFGKHSNDKHSHRTLK